MTVVVSELSRSYGERLALDRVSLEVGEGEIFALLGPNGGGKTTLFRILATLLPSDSGSFTVCGLDPRRSLPELRRRLGVVFQSPSLDKKLTVLENLVFQGRLFGLTGAALTKKAESLLDRFRVLDRKGDLVETLSGGLARRVEIAKCLLHGPRVLLLDEPSTGLDPGARLDLRQALTELSRKDAVTVLLTTHLFEEAEAADRLGILDRGRLLALGTARELTGTLGGEVITVETESEADARTLAPEIAGRFGSRIGMPKVVEAAVRLELSRAHELVPALVEAFPGRFRSVSLGRPSLEDVFVAKTGRMFREAEEGA